MPRCSRWRPGSCVTRSTVRIWLAPPERLRLPEIAELRRHHIPVLADALGQADRLNELAHAVERGLGDRRVVVRQVAFDQGRDQTRLELRKPLPADLGGP